MSDLPYTASQFSALHSETTWVGPELASHLRASCHFERQRPLNRDHIRRLASEMRQGWFLQGTPVWLCVFPDNSMTIVNGNHTLEAVAESGVRIPLTFIYQRVADLDSAAKAYSCFDIQRIRTWTQTATALGIAEEIPLVAKAIPAVGFILQDFSYNPRKTELTQSRQLRFSTISEYKPALEFFSQAIQGAPKIPRRHVTKAAVLAVALVTFRYQPQAAQEFWHEAAMDNGLRSNDPRKAMLRFLENNPIKNNNEVGNLCKGVALAWNAFWEERALELLRPGALREFRLQGTPWHRGVEAKRESDAASAFTKATSQESMVETGIQVNGDGSQDKVAMMVGRW